MKEQASLTANLNRISVPIHSAYPEPMEKLGQDYGFIHYSTFLTGPRPKEEFFIQDLHDRALVFLNGELTATLDRVEPEVKLEFEVPAEGLHVSILVENLGRINYGPYMRDYKGITEGVRYGRQFLSEWTTYTLPLTDLSGLQFEGLFKQVEPSFFRSTLVVDEPCDTFLSMEGWTKGVVFINGFNLGRYWNIGPQKTMYVPGPLLKLGDNEIVIFELHSTSDTAVTFVDLPELG
jgi:beta-galactosidase